MSNLNALSAQVGVTEAGALTEGFILNEQTIRNNERPRHRVGEHRARADHRGSTLDQPVRREPIANWTTAHDGARSSPRYSTSRRADDPAQLLQESRPERTPDGSPGAQWTSRPTSTATSRVRFSPAREQRGPTSEFIIRAGQVRRRHRHWGTPRAMFAVIAERGAEFTGPTNWGMCRAAP